MGQVNKIYPADCSATATNNSLYSSTNDIDDDGWTHVLQLFCCCFVKKILIFFFIIQVEGDYNNDLDDDSSYSEGIFNATKPSFEHRFVKLQKLGNNQRFVTKSFDLNEMKIVVLKNIRSNNR